MYILLLCSSSNKGHVMYNNAFQWDAYCPLVDHIPACTVQGGVSQHALGGVPARGVVYLPWGCTFPGDVCLGVYLPRQCTYPEVMYLPRGCIPAFTWVYLPGGVPVQVGVPARGCFPSFSGADNPLPCGQTDTCENITFANFVCGR